MADNVNHNEVWVPTEESYDWSNLNPTGDKTGEFVVDYNGKTPIPFIPQVDMSTGGNTVKQWVPTEASTSEETATQSHGEALRFNEGKTPYSYLPLDLLDGTAKVMKYGAKKYKDGENFRKGYSDLMDPLDSLIRHTKDIQRAILTQDKDGSKGWLLDIDKEGNGSHEAHCHHIITSCILLIHSMRLQGYKV